MGIFIYQFTYGFRGDRVQNQSDQTPKKQFYLDKILRQHINVVRNIFSKWSMNRSYYYIDTNSGKGWNDKQNCCGSPIVFLEAIKMSRLPYQAYFIDQDEGALCLLEKAIGENSNCHYVVGNNMKVLPKVLDNIPYGSYGVIYHDPNHCPDYDLLKFADNHRNAQKIDLLIRFNANGVKRAKNNKNIVPLADFLKLKKEDGWIIHEPSGKWQWTFILGMNWPNMTPWIAQGFHKLKSPRGQAIFNKLHYTSAQLKEIEEERHPKLFDRDRYKEDIFSKKIQKRKKKVNT